MTCITWLNSVKCNPSKCPSRGDLGVVNEEIPERIPVVGIDITNVRVSTVLLLQS